MLRMPASDKTRLRKPSESPISQTREHDETCSKGNAVVELHSKTVEQPALCCPACDGFDIAVAGTATSPRHWQLETSLELEGMPETPVEDDEPPVVVEVLEMVPAVSTGSVIKVTVRRCF